jgi:glutamine synthetase
MAQGEKYKAFEAFLKTNGIVFLDLKVPDLAGRLRRVTLPVDEVRAGILRDGVGFDSSSYGFSRVESSDMVLIPDLSTAVLDPFRKAPTASVMANIHKTDEDRTRFTEDVRHVASQAEEQLRTLKIADRSLWAPEFEFYIFAGTEFEAGETHSSVRIEPAEKSATNAYHAVNPLDRFGLFRDEAVTLLKGIGIPIRYHHHEGGRFGQQEIEGLPQPLLAASDATMLAKYVLFNLASRQDLSLTFMPKPLFQHAGNGFHLHIFLEKEGCNIFHDRGQYANLSKTALRFIGGILRHARALCAFTNPSTNSYKRLTPGFEAPVSIEFGKSNRTSAIRIPTYVFDSDGTRFEYRPPDLTCNPYLAMAAILMAGIDGIVTGIDPTAEGFGPIDEENRATQKARSILPRDLDEALNALCDDREFLRRGDVFTDALLEKWTQMKRSEASAVYYRPHPYEFLLYYYL